MDAWDTKNPNLQVAWDSTTLGDFRRCPRYYYLRHIECWRAKEENDDLTFGTLFHSALEKYDYARALGQPYNIAVRTAVRYLLEQSGRRSDDGGFVPWTTGNTVKNRYTLLRTVIWYLIKFRQDAFETALLPDGRPAVELSFRFELPAVAPSGLPYVVCGHLDRVVKDGMYHQYMDRKTTKATLKTRYFERFSPDTQMSCYSVAVKVIFGTPYVRGLIDAAQVGVNFSRFLRGSTGRSPAQLDEWVSDTIYWIKQAEACVEKSHWPMNDQGCNIFGGCKFRGICSLDPASRTKFLEADFVRGKRWNPLEIRGE